MALVGRSLELGAIARVVADGAAGRGRLILLAGQPGIGKSRLAEEAARESGLRVVWARCWEEGGAPAFWPWIQVLRALRREGPEVPVPGEIARLLPELGDGAAPARSVAEERFLLFDAIHRYASAVSAARPILIVIDDVHAADVASLQVLAFFASHLSGSPLAVIATYRSSEARTTPEVGALIERLGRDAETIVPRPLAAEDIARLASEAGITDGEAIAAIERAAEGNPLFARELVKLRVRGVAGELPDTVRAAIREHLRRLPEALRALAEEAAVLGRDVSRPLLARLAGRADLAGDLVALVDHGVLVEPVPGRLAFAHGLFVEALHRDLPAERRAQLHARAAELLAGVATEAEVTRHLFEAGPAHTRAAIEMARRAAAVAARQFATDEAAALLERAIAAAPPDDTELGYDLAIELGGVQLAGGAMGAGKATCLRAAELGRALADPHRLARAAATYGLAITVGVTDRALVALIEETLAKLPPEDSPDRARLLARLASALQPADDSRQPIAIARDAIAMARRLGERRVLLEVLFAAMAALTHFGDPTERVALNSQVLALAAELGEPSLALRTHYRLVVDHIEGGDIAAAASHARRYDDLSRDMRQPHVRWLSAALRAVFALHAGDLPGHAAALADSERYFRATGETSIVMISMAAMFRFVSMLAIADDAGIAAAQPMIAESLQSAHRLYEVAVLAITQAIAGDLERTRATLARTSAAELNTFDCAMVFALVSEAAVRCGDRALAEGIYPGVCAKQRWCGSGWPPLAIEAPMERARGMLAAFLGRRDEARAHFAVAVQLVRAAGLRVLLARTLYEWGTSGAASPAEAQAALAEARAIAAELRLPLLARFEAAGPAPAITPETATEVTLVREGETWQVVLGGACCRVKHNRGVEILARLVAEPTRELHVLDLVGAEGTDTGDAGELLDKAAIAAYRARAQELREELDEAEAFNDPGRRARAMAELEAIHDQLAGGTKLGGKPRRAAGAAERARINVQRRIADAIKRIGEHAPEVGRHLESAIRTGAYCSYDPRRR